VHAQYTKALRHIRPFHDVETTNAIACIKIGSPLDYYHSLMVGVSTQNIVWLQ